MRITATAVTHPAGLAAKPSWLLTQAGARAGRLVADGFAALDAHGYHYRLLAELDECGPASQATLGRQCGIDRSDVVAVVNELAARELVERGPDPEDRRRNVITLTPAGKRQLRRLERQLARVQDELLAPLSAGEREVLARLLGRVLDHHTAPAPE